MKSFNEIGLSPEIMQSIQELGYEAPSPIQAATLPVLLGDVTDFIGQAATGTGKTAAFGIPLIEQIEVKNKFVQGLILCPTRELALQVSGQIDLLGKHKGIRSVAIYGGAGYEPQIQGLKQGRAIVVGTPGRVLDHLNRGTLNLKSLKTIVLDEADEMISMGFKEELESILENVPSKSANTWLFSATLNGDVRRVAEKFLDKPKQVGIARNSGEMLSSSIEQRYFAVNEPNKPEVLCKIIDAADAFYGIIFCQTKSLVIDLTKFMQEKGYKVDCLHGDMSQSARESAMKAFRDHRTKILVCTDVASRGLDVKDITHVVNYSLPRELDVYIHRIGRTARSGKTGIAINLVTNSHRGIMRRIEDFTKTRMVEGKIPGRKEIAIKKVSQSLENFKSQTSHERAIECMDAAWKDTLATLSAEEIAGRFLGMIYGDLFKGSMQEEKPQQSHREEPRRGHRRGGGGRGEGGRREGGHRRGSRGSYRGR